MKFAFYIVLILTITSLGAKSTKQCLQIYNPLIPSTLGKLSLYCSMRVLWFSDWSDRHWRWKSLTQYNLRMKFFKKSPFTQLEEVEDEWWHPTSSPWLPVQVGAPTTASPCCHWLWERPLCWQLVFSFIGPRKPENFLVQWALLHYVKCSHSLGYSCLAKACTHGPTIQSQATNSRITIISPVRLLWHLIA